MEAQTLFFSLVLKIGSMVVEISIAFAQLLFQFKATDEQINSKNVYFIANFNISFIPA